MKIYFVIFSFLLSSCSSYVKKMHKQINDEAQAKRKIMSSGDSTKFNFYRDGTAGKIPSSSRLSSKFPGVFRKYRPKRVRGNDLVDDKSEGSLWVGRGERNFLFAKNRFKRSGDIVTIEVMDTLKREITLELARMFPPPKRPKDKNKAKEDKKSEEAGQEEDGKQGGDGKVHDKISSLVVEEVGRDYLLLKGKKEVIYRGRKRKVEIELLVARNNIDDRDSVRSTNAIESNVFVHE